MRPQVSPTVHHRSALGEWEVTQGRVHPSLRPHVLRYTGYVERTTFLRRREPPSAVVPLIINLGPPLRLVDQGMAYPIGFVAGLYDSVAVTDSAGESMGLQVNFSPVGARLFLGIPLGELVNSAVALDDVLGRRAAPLVERLRELSTWDERFAVVDALIASRFAQAPAVPPDLVWAWRQLERSAGAVVVADLATELGCSRKHLSTRFRAEVGLAPKTVARVLRFDRATTLLRTAGPGLSFADLAVRCGYYDQAHLVRDFHQFAGSTPTDYRSRLLPDNGGVVDS